MTKTEKQFKEMYHQTLGKFKDGKTIEESCSLREKWLETSETKLKDILKSRAQNDIVCEKRSELYQEMLYELEPECLIEVFFIGHMIGVFEGWQERHTKKNKSELELKMNLLAMAAKVHYLAIDNADSDEEEQRLEKNFRKLLESTLVQNN